MAPASAATAPSICASGAPAWRHAWSPISCILHGLPSHRGTGRTGGRIPPGVAAAHAVAPAAQPHDTTHNYRTQPQAGTADRTSQTPSVAVPCSKPRPTPRLARDRDAPEQIAHTTQEFKPRLARDRDAPRQTEPYLGAVPSDPELAIAASPLSRKPAPLRVGRCMVDSVLGSVRAPTRTFRGGLMRILPRGDTWSTK